MIEDIEQYAPDQAPDIYFAFGYAAGMATAQVLNQAVENSEDPENPDLSQGAIAEAMASLDVVDTGGVLGDYEYGPADERTPPRGNRMFRVVPGEENPLAAITDTIESDPAQAFTFDDA